MDSNEINSFAKQFRIKRFLGVFAVDELSLIPRNRHGLVIFNTDTSQSLGQHWLALCITKTKIFYFDSLNSNFQHSPHFTDFMKYTKKRINMEHNSNSVQYIREMWNPLFGFLLCYA